MTKIQGVALVAFCISILTLAGCSTQSQIPTSDDTGNIATTTTAEGDKVVIETNDLSYVVPKRHQESIKVKVTLNKSTNTIDDIEVQNSENDHESVEYQRAFNEGIKAQVVGKPIDQAMVGTINGASLTSQAFNQALEQIKEKGLTTSAS